MKTNREFYILVFLSVILFAVGCKQAPYKVVKLEGTVKYDGQPLGNVQVRFTPEEGRPSTALTTSDGSFKAKYSPEIMGVQIGLLQVNITPMSVYGTPGQKPVISNIDKAVNEKYGYGTPGFQIEVNKVSSNFVIDLPK